MKVYRVKNKEGLYSKGGMLPKFTKKGKLWTSSGALKNHFHLIEYEFYSYERKTYYWKEVKDVYKDCVVEEHDFDTGEIKILEIDSFWVSKHKEHV
jgi:hypothetical protein